MLVAVCGSRNELIDECIAVCGSRNGIVVRSMLMHVFVVFAYAHNDSKTVLLHLIRGPMTEMASVGGNITLLDPVIKMSTLDTKIYTSEFTHYNVEQDVEGRGASCQSARLSTRWFRNIQLPCHGLASKNEVYGSH